MESAARALLIVILVALLINFMQGGKERVIRWMARTLTGRDLKAPVQGPPAPAVGAATPTHQVMV